MTRHGLARSIATWAKNPSGYTWAEVAPLEHPPLDEDIYNWANGEIEASGIMGDAKDDALDNVMGLWRSNA